MPSFKEWLVLESIRTDIIAPIHTSMVTEAVLEEFLRLFFEETQECEHCGYVGEFEEKDDDYVCPRCGKPETIEPDDPFASGDEDAKPVEIDHEAIEKERQDAEKARAEAEHEEAMRKARKTIHRLAGRRGEPAHLSEAQREFAMRLKNNALWVRWHSMLERKLDIDRLKKIAAAYQDEIKSLSEGFGIFDDDEDEAPAPQVGEAEKKPDLDEAEEILVRLGYIRPEKLAMLKTEDNKRRAILKALSQAINEDGNDLPRDVNVSEIMEPVKGKDGKEEVDRWGRAKMRPSAMVEKAKNQLISDLSGLDETTPDTFRRAFKSVAEERPFRGAKKGQVGHMLLSDPEDVANEFVTKMMNMLSRRKVTAEGKAKSWGAMHSDHPELGSSGKKDLRSDEAIGSILGSWRQRIFRIAQEAEHDRRLALAPTAQRPDEVKRRTEVNSRMNKDINAAKAALYAKSMLDGGSSKAEVAEKLGKTEAEVDAMARDPYASLRFHINYLRSVKNGTEESISASGDDKYRLELMKQIVIRANPQMGITLDPDNIIRTLETYRDNYSTKGRARPILAGQEGGGDESGSNDLSQGLEALAKARSDDESPDKGGVFSGSASNITPAAQAMAKERRIKILQYLYEAMRELAKPRNKQDIKIPQGEDYKRTCFWNTLAVSIKLGLPYDPRTGRIIQGTIDDELVDAFFNQSAEEGGQKCFQQLMAIGNVNVEEVHKRLSEMALRLRGQNISRATSYQWLTDGLKFICDHLKKIKVAPV